MFYDAVERCAATPQASQQTLEENYFLPNWGNKTSQEFMNRLEICLFCKTNEKYFDSEKAANGVKELKVDEFSLFYF